MKNILKYTLVIAISVLGVSACRDDNKVRFPDFQTGVSARVSLYADNSYINLDDLAGAAVKFDIYTYSKDIEEIVYTADFVDASLPDKVFPTITALTVKGSDFVSGKITGTGISATALAEKFGFAVEYMEGGDKITFHTAAKLKDGRIMDASNSAPSITEGSNASFTTSFVVFVGCPSPQDKIVGSYYSIMEYNDAGEPTGDTVKVDVTFAGPEPFRYKVSDHTVELYVPYGGTQYPATFYDLCGTTILQPAKSFGNVINDTNLDSNFLAPAVTINGDDVEFVLNWTETFNGISASVRFVKIK